MLWERLLIYTHTYIHTYIHAHAGIIASGAADDRIMLWDCASEAARFGPVALDTPPIHNALRILEGHSDSVLCLSMCR